MQIPLWVNGTEIWKGEKEFFFLYIQRAGLRLSLCRNCLDYEKHVVCLRKGF